MGGTGAGVLPNPNAPLGHRILHWFVSASSMAVAVSILIHALITLVAALVTVGVAGLGTRGSGGGEFNLTITTDGQLTGIMEAAPLEAMAPSVTDAVIPELPTAGVAEGSGGM